MTQYLLEVGMEEIPARFLKSLSIQLEEHVVEFLNDNRLDFQSTERFATPRRLAVRVNGLAKTQSDVSETVRGPALRIAKQEGEWTKAALGFVKGQGATIDDIIIDKVKDEDYIFVNKFTKGKSAKEVLTGISSVLKAMNFPVSMTWNTIETPFIRPIHWMISLLEDTVIPFEFVNVVAGKTTRGHHFIGGEVDINHPSEYEEKLKTQYVIASFEKRTNLIVQQIETLAENNNWNVPIDEDLLEEVTSIVEWPTAFYGDFESNYLEIPRIVLITAMRDHQRYFYVEDKESGELLPLFISVRNGNSDYIDNVIRGNQKVLRARLEDALFFYQEDLKRPLESYVDQLANVREHLKIGSFADKQERVSQVIDLLAHSIIESNVKEEDIQTAKEASAIYKFDLVTGMVDEFSELQGQIGEIYAKSYGKSDAVAQAIGSQYLPDHSGGDLPESTAGALLALADKLDTVYNYFKVDLIPSGSQDPYALRRQAMGIVEIILNQNWNINLTQLLMNMDKGNVNESLIERLSDFIRARIAQHLEQYHIDYDIVEGVLSIPIINVTRFVESAKVIQEYKNSNPDEYRQVIEDLSRVLNLGAKIEEVRTLKKELIQSESEAKLLSFVMDKVQMISPKEQLMNFITLSKLIHDYFEDNMVNDDNEKIRFNRLETMRRLTEMILTMVDARLLISKFNKKN